MKLKFTFLSLFLGCISIFIINTKFISNVKAEELLKVELNKEIKKGKFLIGLKQYLGGENDIFSKKKITTKPLIESIIPREKVVINQTRSYQNSLPKLTYKHIAPTKTVNKPVLVNFSDRITQSEI